MPELESGWYKIKRTVHSDYEVAVYDVEYDAFFTDSFETMRKDVHHIGPMLMRPNGEIVNHPILTQHSA